MAGRKCLLALTQLYVLRITYEYVCTYTYMYISVALAVWVKGQLLKETTNRAEQTCEQPAHQHKRDVLLDNDNDVG